MKSIKQLLEADLKDNEASSAEYLALVEFAKPYEGKRITRAIANKLPAGYKLTDGHSGLEIIAPSGRKHYFVRTENMGNFTLKGFHDHNSPYSQGAPERIEKLKAILDNPKKLKKCEEYFDTMKKSYDELKKLAKKSEDEFGSFENPAYYDILKEYKMSNEIISDLYFDKDLDKLEKGGTAGEVACFKDEGDFYTLKLTKDGKLPEDKMYPFGELVPKHFHSKTEAKEFAETNGWKASFDFQKGGKTGVDKKNPYYVKPISGETRKAFRALGLEVLRNTTNGLLIAEDVKTHLYGLYTQECEEVAPPKYQMIDGEVNANGMTRVTHADGSSGAIEAFILSEDDEMGRGGKAKATHVEGGIDWLITG